MKHVYDIATIIVLDSKSADETHRYSFTQSLHTSRSLPKTTQPIDMNTNLLANILSAARRLRNMTNNRKLDTPILRALTPDTTSQLNVLGHNCNSLRMDSAQIGIFKQPHEVSLRGFLQRHHSRTLEAKV